MRCDGVNMPERENDPPLRTWWRWPSTGALVYWVSEDLFLSYLEERPGVPLGHEQTAIVRRDCEKVLVLHGDHRQRLQHLSLPEMAAYYDGCPDKVDETLLWEGEISGGPFYGAPRVLSDGRTLH